MSDVNPADPLGLRRCPNCLYDRLGMDATSPCPECGYVVPAGVVVFTLPRVTESTGLVVLQFVALAGLILLSLSLFGASMRHVVESVAFTLPGVTAIVVRAIRVAWSQDAYIPQVWIGRAGIGVERDADRYSPLRPIARVASPALGYGAYVATVALQFADLHGLRFVAIPAALVGGAAGAVWLTRRRAATPPLDGIAPQLLRWDRVRCVVSAADGKVGVGLILPGFWALPLGIEGMADDATIAALRREIAAAGGRSVEGEE